MADRVSVMSWLEGLTQDDWRQYHSDSEVQEIARSALDLLTEQEKPDCEHAEHDGIGCLGYAECTQDDEPIDVCRTCRKYTVNRFEKLMDLLEEQEPVPPKFDAFSVRCGNCGGVLEVAEPDPYCPMCGRKVKW